MLMTRDVVDQAGLRALGQSQPPARKPDIVVAGLGVLTNDATLARPPRAVPTGLPQRGTHSNCPALTPLLVSALAVMIS
jgi:hypothetical protein